MVLALKSSYLHAGTCTTPVATALPLPWAHRKAGRGQNMCGNVPHIRFLAAENRNEVQLQA